MAGINGLAVTFRAQANVRIYKFSVLVKDAADTTQNQQFAGLPAAVNAPGFMGVTIEHFVEPDYFVAQGTNPTTVTGTTPSVYVLTGRGVQAQVSGIARCLAAGAINQGDAVIVADAYGRVQTANQAANTNQCIGRAQNTTAAANDVVEVLLEQFVQ